MISVGVFVTQKELLLQVGCYQEHYRLGRVVDDMKKSSTRQPIEAIITAFCEYVIFSTCWLSDTVTCEQIIY